MTMRSCMGVASGKCERGSTLRSNAGETCVAVLILTAAIRPWHSPAMKTEARKELGRFVVADPKICRGRPTFKGTRITVADVLADVQRGLSWDFISERWGDGKITRKAIAEAVQLARSAFLDQDGRLADDVAAVA